MRDEKRRAVWIDRFYDVVYITRTRNGEDRYHPVSYYEKFLDERQSKAAQAELQRKMNDLLQLHPDGLLLSNVAQMYRDTYNEAFAVTSMKGFLWSAGLFLDDRHDENPMVYPDVKKLMKASYHTKKESDGWVSVATSENKRAVGNGENPENAEQAASRKLRKLLSEEPLEDLGDLPMKLWSVERTAGWISSIGEVFQPLAATFVNKGINGAKLAKLDLNGLRELGVSNLGHRKTIYNRVRTHIKPIGTKSGFAQKLSMILEQHPNGLSYSQLGEFWQQEYSERLFISGKTGVGMIIDKFHDICISKFDDSTSSWILFHKPDTQVSKMHSVEEMKSLFIRLLQDFPGGLFLHDLVPEFEIRFGSCRHLRGSLTTRLREWGFVVYDEGDFRRVTRKSQFPENLANILAENPQGISDEDFEIAWKELTGMDTGFPSSNTRVNRIMTTFYNICKVEKVDGRWIYYPKGSESSEDAGNFDFDVLEENVSSILESNGTNGIYLPNFMVNPFFKAAM